MSRRASRLGFGSLGISTISSLNSSTNSFPTCRADYAITGLRACTRNSTGPPSFVPLVHTGFNMTCCSLAHDDEWLDNFIHLVAIVSGLDLGFNDHIDHLHPATKRITADLRFTLNMFPKFKDLWCDGKDTHIFPLRETRLLFDMPPDPPQAIYVINEELLFDPPKKGEKQERADKTIFGKRLGMHLELVIKDLAVQHVYGEAHAGFLDLRVMPKGAKLEDYNDMLRVVKAKDMYKELKKDPPLFAKAKLKKECADRIAELKREAEANAKRKETEAKKSSQPKKEITKDPSGPKKKTKKGPPGQKKEAKKGSEEKAEDKKGGLIPPEKMMELMDWYLEKTKLE